MCESSISEVSIVSAILCVRVCTVRVKITCPNLREEYSSCGPYKFTCKHCVRPRTSIERFLHSPLCTKNEEQLKLGARYSNSRGMGLLKRWVVVRVACLPLPVQP